MTEALPVRTCRARRATLIDLPSHSYVPKPTLFIRLPPPPPPALLPGFDVFSRVGTIPCAIDAAETDVSDAKDLGFSPRVIIFLTTSCFSPPTPPFSSHRLPLTINVSAQVRELLRVPVLAFSNGVCPLPPLVCSFVSFVTPPRASRGGNSHSSRLAKVYLAVMTNAR